VHKRGKHQRNLYNSNLIELAATMQTANYLSGSQLSTYGPIDAKNNYSLISLNRTVLTYLYSGSGIVRRAIQIPVLDGMSKGVEIVTDEADHEEIKQVEKWLRKKKFFQQIINAKTWARLYGGGGIVINSGQNPEEELNIEDLDEDIEFYAVDRWQLSTTKMIGHEVENVFMGFGNEEYYYLYSEKVHESRVMVMKGVEAPSYIRRQLRGWGLSVCESAIRDLNNYLKTDDVLYEILDESKVDIYYIKGLANKLLTTGGTSAIQQRVQAANQIKNYLSALLLDEQDRYEQKTLTFAGLAEIKKENRIGIAGAWNMPVTKLFGISAAGFNSGEDDIENYNAMVESEIRQDIEDSIHLGYEIGFQVLFGYIPKFDIKWPSLRIVSDKEDEEVKASKANRLLAFYQNGLPWKNVLAQAKKDELFTIEIDEDAMPDKPPLPNGEPEKAKISVVKNKSKGLLNRIFKK